MSRNVPSTFQVIFKSGPGGWLEAIVQGESGSLENAVTYWRSIVEELRKTGAQKLLVIDRMHGSTLSPKQYEALVERFRGAITGKVRVAVVIRDARLMAAAEHGALAGRAGGMNISVFSDLPSAEIWLRYGDE